MTTFIKDADNARRRRRSTAAEFLVVIIFIEELNQTVTANVSISANNTQTGNNTQTVTVDFDIGQILEEALNITQQDLNITLEFEVANMTVVEGEIKEVNYFFIVQILS